MANCVLCGKELGRLEAVKIEFHGTKQVLCDHCHTQFVRTAGGDRLALEQNREVFAFPGPADGPASLGANRLIQRGEAKLVLSARDVLEEFAAQFPSRVHPLPPMEAEAVRERYRFFSFGDAMYIG